MRLTQLAVSLLIIGVFTQLPQHNIANNVDSLNTPLTFTTTSNIQPTNIGTPLSFITQQPNIQINQQQIITPQATQQVQQQIIPQTSLPIGALPLGQYLTNGTSIGLTATTATTTAQVPIVFSSQQQQVTSSGIIPPIGAVPLGKYLDNGLNLDDGIIYGYQFQTGCDAKNSYKRNEKNSDNSRKCPRFKSDDDKNGYSSLEQYFYSLSKNGKDGSHQDASFYFPAGLIPTNSPISLITEGFFVNRSSSCPINEYLNGNTCNCIPGFERNSGARNCKLSKHYEVPQSQSIKILDAPSKSQCVSDYSYVTSDGYCTCQLGYVFNTKYVCFPVPKGLTCPQGSILYPDNTCSCPKNFFLNSGVCRSCPPYHYWSGSNCISNCPANSVYDAIRRNCTCNAGFITTSPDVCSPCTKGFTSHNNLCVKCPINSQLIGGQCTCLPGSRNVGGNCVSICPPQAYYDETLKKCMCLQTNCYVNQNNVCTSCAVGTYYNGHSCITCSPESYFDPVTRTCRICVRPSIVVNSVCVTCPIGTVFAPLINQCVCSNVPGAPIPIYCQSFRFSSEFFQSITTTTNTIACVGNSQLIGGICLSCPPNSTSINGICSCNNGFSNNTSIHPNGICTAICPTGMYNAKGQCIMCPVNSIWSDAAQQCICQSGYATSKDYPGKCVSISLLQSSQTTFFTNTTSSISGYCPTGCPFGYKCNINNQCVQESSNTGGLTYEQQQLLLQQQQQYQNYLQQQQQQQQQYQQQQQQQTIVHQTNSVSLSSASISVANIFSGINNATFTARVSPVPRSMVFNFPNLQANLFPSGTCQQTADLNIWNCIINYKNQPISTAYTVILTASADIGNWSTQFTVNPVRSNM